MIVGLVLLAAVTVFGYTGHLSSSDTYSALFGLIGLVGVSGLYVIASSAFTNTSAIPQLIVGVGIVGALVVLGLHNVFDSAQIQAMLLLIITGAAAGSGGVVVATAARSQQVAAPPAPEPAPSPPSPVV